MKTRRNMILVAAEKDLRLLVSEGEGKGVTEMRHVRAADLARSSADPGRISRFAKGIADYAESEWRKGGYDRLTLVAGTAMLRDLRQELPDRLRDRISAVLDRDLIDRPVRDIAGQLREIHAI
ncbi:host attachment family protein [Rhodobacteraceae bacterium HSP-20]|uniref:Host attachment family protein n=1 Tax=Paragemmobacter amnigenus TaxID=2852097 RepID=A0ABS6IZR6_9RHOB|nr:host attachment protein [Rhodobacter amnigenus]MBU9696787.1 host attachment family protein [Rhodobacter amnigenus]MBV4388014.1 host attachment family protein [Rhodobacter amnigenus]